MTKLTERKTRLIVETPATQRERRRDREIIIRFHQWGMTFRLKGMRREYSLTFNQAFNHAADLHAMAERRARIEARKKKKESR
jgi:hypothetical protein